MTESAQGPSVELDNLDEASINSIIDGVRSSKGPTSNLATAIINLNKREAKNHAKLDSDFNRLSDTIIDTLSRKIDEAVTGVKDEVKAISDRINSVHQQITHLNQKATIIDSNKDELEKLRREFEDFKNNPPVEFINKIIKKSVVKIIGPAYARELKSLNKVLEISKVPQDDENELPPIDRIKKYVIEPLNLAPALHNDTVPTDVTQIDTTDGSEKFQVTFKTSKAIGNIFKNINGKNISASINKIVPEDFKYKHDSFKRRSHSMKFILDAEGRSVRKGRVDFKDGVLHLYAKDKVGLADYGPEYIVDSYFPELDTTALIPADEHLKMQYKGLKVIFSDPVEQTARSGIESLIRQHPQVLNCRFLNSGYACIITYDKNATPEQISAAYQQAGIPHVKRADN